MDSKKVFKPKKLGYPIPEELEESIGNYIEYLNGDETGRYLSEDLYQMEVLSELNYCKREGILSDEDVSKLKHFYIFGGIHKEKENDIEQNKEREV